MNKKVAVLNGDRINFDGAVDYGTLSEEVVVYGDSRPEEIVERAKGCAVEMCIRDRLINDVLDMSKIESGEMALRSDVLSLPEELENVVTIMQPQFKQKEQQFSIRLHGVVHEQFLSDALRLRQVLLNILSNAGKFTPERGSISLDVQELRPDQPATARIRFVISDTGMGMSAEFQKHLFDAFSRERDSRLDRIEGTGLGMAITKKIVELLQGTIEVTSRPGQGSKFAVCLLYTSRCV